MKKASPETCSAAPRLRPVEAGDPSLDPALEDLIRLERGGRLLLLYRVLLNSPPVAFGWLKLFTALRQQTELPGRLRELVILRVAALNQAEYEFEAHVPFAQAEGLSPETIALLHSGKLPPELSALEIDALRYTDQMTRHVMVPRELHESVARHFSARDMLELTVLIGAYNMVSRVLVALSIQSEH